MDRVFAFAAIAAFVSVAASGCMGNGTFGLYGTDPQGSIGDFSSLTVTAKYIELQSKDGKAQNLTPAKSTFDLTKLTNSNTTNLFDGSVPAGNYTKLTIFISGGQGTLVSGGSTSVRGGKIMLNTAFTIASGKETDFLFDFTVGKQGNNQYFIQPNASGHPLSGKPAKVQ